MIESSIDAFGRTAVTAKRTRRKTQGRANLSGNLRRNEQTNSQEE